MQDFWLYIQLGLEHVLDFDAYDHILFLAALAVPFTFKNWKKVVLLATIFTIAHCTSLAFSAYDIMHVDAGLIEFSIPITIALTALLNLSRVYRKKQTKGIFFLSLATAFFGLIHGFGFSNYFNLLMAEEENKLIPLFGFAGGIEISQVSIILIVLALAFLTQNILKIKQALFIAVLSIIIVIITVPMLINTFPS